jgi:hypothetical protein
LVLVEFARVSRDRRQPLGEQEERNGGEGHQDERSGTEGESSKHLVADLADRFIEGLTIDRLIGR